jgi:hypothetical protein
MLTFGKATLVLAALSVVALGAPARATELIVNGGFDVPYIGQAPTAGSEFGTGYSAMPGWTTSGYNFYFVPGSADTTGTYGQYGKLTLWGPANGGVPGNALPATSPQGGNYVAADGAYEVDAIRQTITGLTVGKKYLLSFYFAAAQQDGYTGDTTEQWQVSLGTETHATPILSNPSHDFQAWRRQTFTYVAVATSEVLSFLAVGTPNGEPPFSLLDGASMTEVPEPATVAVLGAGLFGLGLTRLRKRNKIAPAATA